MDSWLFTMGTTIRYDETSITWCMIRNRAATLWDPASEFSGSPGKSVSLCRSWGKSRQPVVFWKSGLAKLYKNDWNYFVWNCFVWNSMKMSETNEKCLKLICLKLFCLKLEVVWN
jgi:hypothetical protein